MAPVLLIGIVAVAGCLNSIAAVGLIYGGRYTVMAFRRGGARYVNDTRIHAAVLLVAVLVNWTATYLWVRVLDIAVAVFPELATGMSPVSLVALGFLAVVTVAPPVYLWSGLVAQSLGAVWTLAQLLYLSRTGRPAPDAVATAVGMPVRVVDVPDPYAVGVAIGPYRRILISAAFLDALEPAEARAIVAHEHAHVVEYKDAQLGLLVPIPSSLTLVSQSLVLFLPILSYSRVPC
jgi:Zn-dependent protease with chaperone function